MARGKKAEKVLTLEEKLERALVPVEEQPYSIPKNWCWIELSNISKVRTGKKDANYGSADGEYYFFTCATKAIRCVDYSFDCKAILLAGNGDISNISMYEGKFEAYQRTYVVEIVEPIITEFCYHYFNYRWVDYNKDKMFGTAIPYIRLGNLQKFPMPVAPHGEQQRIVDRIGSLFAKLDEAKEKAQAVVDGFELRKSAILHKAFTGELTKQWRKANGVTRDSWVLQLYRDLGSFKLGKMLDKAKNTGMPTPYLRNVNVRWFEFDLSDVACMLASEEERELLSVKKGDLFICEGGEPGRCAIWKDDDSELIFQKALHRFRPNEKVISDFLCYNLYYMSLSDLLAKHFTGTTIKHLTGKSLSDIRVILPSIEEQEEVVKILDKLFTKEQQAKAAAESVLDQIDTMKKAILARAFRGELGTNDPTEESAVELLKTVL